MLSDSSEPEIEYSFCGLVVSPFASTALRDSESIHKFQLHDCLCQLCTKIQIFFIARSWVPVQAVKVFDARYCFVLFQGCWHHPPYLSSPWFGWSTRKHVIENGFRRTYMSRHFILVCGSQHSTKPQTYAYYLMRLFDGIFAPEWTPSENDYKKSDRRHLLQSAPSKLSTDCGPALFTYNKSSKLQALSIVTPKAQLSFTSFTIISRGHNSLKIQSIWQVFSEDCFHIEFFSDRTILREFNLAHMFPVDQSIARGSTKYLDKPSKRDLSKRAFWRVKMTSTQLFKIFIKFKMIVGVGAIFACLHGA